MKHIKAIFIYGLFQFFFHVAIAQKFSADNVWLPVKYVEDIRQNKTFMNRGVFCNPIEVIYTDGGELYFKTYLGRAVKADYVSRGTNRYELTNVQGNINHKYTSADTFERRTFTIVTGADTVLLLSRAPNCTSDTTKFIAPVSKKLSSPLHVIEGYVLLQGRYDIVASQQEQDEKEVSFDVNGNVDSEIWKSYKLLASSFLLEDKSLNNPSRFLIQLQGDDENVEERVLLCSSDGEMELYEFTRNEQHEYVLNIASKIILRNIGP